MTKARIRQDKKCDVCGRDYMPSCVTQRYCGKVCAYVVTQANSLRKWKEDKKRPSRAMFRLDKSCTFCGEFFTPSRSTTTTCSKECQAGHNKKRSLERYHRKKSGIGNIPYAVAVDTMFDDRNFSEADELINPGLVDSLLYEAQERNKGIKYRYRCRTCAGKITDEDASTKEGEHWYCDDKCYRLKLTRAMIDNIDIARRSRQYKTRNTFKKMCEVRKRGRGKNLRIAEDSDA